MASLFFFRGHRFLVSDVAEDDKEFGVDVYFIVQQGAHCNLNMIDDFAVKFGAAVGVGRVLGIGAIVDFAMFVW